MYKNPTEQTRALKKRSDGIDHSTNVPQPMLFSVPNAVTKMGNT